MFLMLLCLPAKMVSAADSWQGKVVNVIDGATLDIATPDGGVERVRLFAVSVPPPGQPKADDAQKRTASWCYQWGDVAEVLPMGLDKDGQMVARVIVGQEDLANALAKACLARINIKPCRVPLIPECVGWHAWELQCRDEQKGLWEK